LQPRLYRTQNSILKIQESLEPNVTANRETTFAKRSEEDGFTIDEVWTAWQLAKADFSIEPQKESETH
jgi:hypothetical protein